MTYKLVFDIDAQKEWNKLDKAVQSAFKKVLERRLINPVVPKDRLSGFTHDECYKIKLRSYGFRLVYRIEQDKVILFVISVGKRENDEVYINMAKRLK